MNDVLLPPSVKRLKTQYLYYGKNANKTNANNRKNQQVFTCSKSTIKTLKQGV